MGLPIEAPPCCNNLESHSIWGRARLEILIALASRSAVLGANMRRQPPAKTKEKKKNAKEGEREATPCYLGTGRRGRGKGGLNRSERAISSNAGTLPEGTRQDLRDENRASAAREVGSSDDRGVSSVAVTTRADPPQAWQAAKREPRPARERGGWRGGTSSAGAWA